MLGCFGKERRWVKSLENMPISDLNGKPLMVTLIVADRSVFNRMSLVCVKLLMVRRLRVYGFMAHDSLESVI